MKIVKMFIAFFVILLILFVAHLFFSRGSMQKSISNILPTSLQCSKAAQIIIDEKGISDVHGCSTQVFSVDGEQVSVVSLNWGPGMDCPSGCIYQGGTYLLDENNTIFPFYSPPSPLAELLSTGRQIGDNCLYFDTSKNIGDSFIRTIVKIDGLYQWQLRFHNFDALQYTDKEMFGDFMEYYPCIFNGTVTFNYHPENKYPNIWSYDISQLNVQPQPPTDCKTLSCVLDHKRLTGDTEQCIEEAKKVGQPTNYCSLTPKFQNM